jgi:hypothetical protein
MKEMTMTNSGAQLAYTARVPQATHARGATLRRAWRALRTAFNEAPFDLLWPPAAPQSLPRRRSTSGHAGR